MKKVKAKTEKVAKIDVSKKAAEFRDSFLRKGFSTEQAFQLTLLVLSKSIRWD